MHSSKNRAKYMKRAEERKRKLSARKLRQTLEAAKNQIAARKTLHSE